MSTGTAENCHARRTKAWCSRRRRRPALPGRSRCALIERCKQRRLRHSCERRSHQDGRRKRAQEVVGHEPPFHRVQSQPSRRNLLAGLPLCGRARAVGWNHSEGALPRGTPHAYQGDPPQMREKPIGLRGCDVPRMPVLGAAHTRLLPKSLCAHRQRRPARVRFTVPSHRWDVRQKGLRSLA